MFDLKITEELSFMTLKGDTKFEKTCGLESDMRNMQIFTRAIESLKIGILMGSFNPMQKSMSLKSTGNEEGCKM